MEIVIHGTKQGHKSNLIPNSSKHFELNDIRNGVNDEKPLGYFFYSIALKNGGCTYTKYIIVRDTLRGFAVGNIGFSLYLPSNKELKNKGTDIKALLDKLSEYYTEKYIKDNNINCGETILINENWSFIEQITNKYEIVTRNIEEENIESGELKPAIHYYMSEMELIELFEKPYQEEYQPYEQILFIDSHFKGESNPLKVIRNSGVEVNPDLENKTFYIQNYQSDKNVKIVANGKTRSNKRGENTIKIKWQTEITYIKNEKYYRPIHKKGTINELASEGFFEIRGNQILINYNAFNDPEPIVLPIHFCVYDHNQSIVEKAEINLSCESSKYPVKKIHSNNSISFSGEEMKEKWIAIASYKELSGKKAFIPEKENNDKVKIIINKRIRINFEVKDDQGNKIVEYEVWTNVSNGFITRDYVEFTDKEIDKTYNITISKEGYESFKINDFRPQKNESKIITLKKIRKKPKIGTPEDKTKTKKLDHFFSKPPVIAGTIVFIVALILGIIKLEDIIRNNKQPTESKANNEPNITDKTADSSTVTNNHQNDSTYPHREASDYPLSENINNKDVKLESNEVSKNDPESIHKAEDNSHEIATKVSDKTRDTSNQEIINYIKGSELKEGILKKYMDTNISTDLKQSIKLCLEFWELDGKENDSGENSYKSFQIKIKSDKHLSDSQLMKFIDSIAKEEDPSYRKETKRQGLK